MPLTDPLEPRSAASAAVRPTTRLAAASTLNTVLESLVRLGYVVRGILYLLPGVLALRVALGRPGEEISPTAAIELIGHEPFGIALLFGVGAGLAGYAIWGVIRAVFDPLHKGHSSRGLAQRTGYAISAVAYMGLVAATFQYAAGPQSHMGQPRDWTGALLARPAGAWMVAIIGVCWIIGAGLAQIVSGWRGEFEADLAIERMSRSERRWANRLGRFGIVARGAVFTVIGVLMVAAALHASPPGSAGMGGALIEILRQPFGRTLLGAAAIGLIAFGAFSVMGARWMRIRPAASSSWSGFIHSFGL
jgi:hypothetical protein